MWVCVHLSVYDFRFVACVFVYPQERRREFEANLEKEGLELESEDKSVRNSTEEYLLPLVDLMLRHSTFFKKLLKGWLIT